MPRAARTRCTCCACSCWRSTPASGIAGVVPPAPSTTVAAAAAAAAAAAIAAKPAWLAGDCPPPSTLPLAPRPRMLRRPMWLRGRAGALQQASAEQSYAQMSEEGRAAVCTVKTHPELPLQPCYWPTPPSGLPGLPTAAPSLVCAAAPPHPWHAAQHQSCRQGAMLLGEQRVSQQERPPSTVNVSRRVSLATFQAYLYTK